MDNYKPDKYAFQMRLFEAINQHQGNYYLFVLAFIVKRNFWARKNVISSVSNWTFRAVVWEFVELYYGHECAVFFPGDQVTEDNGKYRVFIKNRADIIDKIARINI